MQQPMTIVSRNGTSIELRGTIAGMISGGFTINGGAGVGSLHIYTNASTVITGPALFVNEYVDVVGTGTISTSVTASSVSQYATPTPTPSPTAAPTATPVATTGPVLVSNTPGPTAAPSGVPITLPSGVIISTGQIGSISGGKITIQTGPGCGWMTVTVNSATAYFDGNPSVGQYAAFTGTGTRCASITSANSMSLSASAFTSGTVSGTVASATPYGFILNTGSANVPVALASSTVVFGSTLVVGSNVTVTALGTAATGLTATQIAVSAPPTPTPNPSMSPTPTPAPISTTHVQTFAYIYGYAGTPTTIPLGSMAPYVTWTQTDQAHAAAIRAAGVKVQVYTNFWRNYTSDNPSVGYTDLAPGGVNAAAEARDCSSNVITDSSYGGGYEADARSANALPHALAVVNYRLNSFSGNYDAVFADDSGSVWGITLPCGYSQSDYDAAVNNVHSQINAQVWVNALGAAPNPATATDLVAPANVAGAMCEICYAGNGGSGDSLQTGNTWINVANAEINTISQGKTFWDYARLTGDASAETSQRVYAYASFLLTYDPSHAMFQEALSTPSGFPVMPENGLVPLNPLTTASTVSGYQGAGGAYIREFSNCYYRGSFVSACAVVVNPSAASVPVPSTSYSHSLALSGYGVLDGGSASFNGPAVTTLGPASAAILFP
ncbi:MAG TPA: hypothetical protein VFL13_02005 [Candidatus Baltobacteraceae bacterium]|nr:hypothetical protein [Candidatus Baltobacteraceae bacterium]